jgi:hypothetical protein
MKVVILNHFKILEQCNDNSEMTYHKLLSGTGIAAESLSDSQ